MLSHTFAAPTRALQSTTASVVDEGGGMANSDGRWRNSILRSKAITFMITNDCPFKSGKHYKVRIDIEELGHIFTEGEINFQDFSL